MSGTWEFWLDWLPRLLTGMKVSLQVTSASLLVGIPLGLVLAVAVMSPLRPLRWAALALVEIGRGAPLLILLQFAYYGLPSAGIALAAFWAAVLALGWCCGAYTSEIIRAGLQAVPQGQKEAAAAVGLSAWDELRFIVIPQGLRVALPGLLGFAILLFQGTSLCFAITLPEVVSRAYAIGSSSFRYFEIFVLVAILFASVCIPATLAVAAIERRFGRHA